MSIKVKPTIKRNNEEIDEISVCPEAMNDPENLVMRRSNKKEEKFVKDYDTIKNKLDNTKKEIEYLKTNNYNSWERLKLLGTIEIVLKWVLSEDDTDL